MMRLSSQYQRQRREEDGGEGNENLEEERLFSLNFTLSESPTATSPSFDSESSLPLPPHHHLTASEASRTGKIPQNHDILNNNEEITFSEENANYASSSSFNSGLPILDKLISGVSRFFKSFSTSVRTIRHMPQIDYERRVAYDDFSTIDWTQDFMDDRIRRFALLREKGSKGMLIRIFDILQGWIVSVLMAIAVGWFAGFIVVSSEWLSDLKDGYCIEGFYLNRKFCCFEEKECKEWNQWTSPNFFGYIWGLIMYLLFSGIFAICSALLVNRFSPMAAGSGIPEVKTILGGFIIRDFLGFWTLIVKAIGLPLSVASGLALGKEGPLVHVACCLGNICSNMFSKYRLNEANKREILTAACAAGVSVAFGAPIGGVLFALEEVSHYFPFKTMWRSFFCAMIAALTLQVINPFRTGKLVLFQVAFTRDWRIFELPAFVFLGLLGGIIGSTLIRYTLKMTVFRRNSWLKEEPIKEVLIVALVTGFINYVSVFSRISLGELVAKLFRECKEMDSDFLSLCNKEHSFVIVISLTFVAIIKLCSTIVTFGTQVPAGIFIPSMAIGACLGRSLGIIMEAFQEAYPKLWIFSSCTPDVQCVTPGTYAMVGAAAILAGVTRMTISLVVVMFELTGALSFVLPIMVTVMTSRWVGDALFKQGMYDALIELNGYPFLENMEDIPYGIVAKEIMVPVHELELIYALEDHSVSSLAILHDRTNVKGFPVVKSRQDLSLIGYINRPELQEVLRRVPSNRYHCIFNEEAKGTYEHEIDLRPWMDLTPTTLIPHFPLEMVIELFRSIGLRYAVVTKRGQVKGMITKKDLLRRLKQLKVSEDQ